MAQYETSLPRRVPRGLRLLVVGQIQHDQIDFIEKQLARQSDIQFDRRILVDDEPAKGIEARRAKIAQNHKILHEKVFDFRYEYDYIIQIEGDSVLKEGTFARLIGNLDQVPADQLGYISGIQVGRHGIYAIGAWHFNDDQTEYESVNHKVKDGIIEVDATGFYCLIAPIKSWLMGNCYYYDERWGPDVNWGLSLKEQGYHIYVDMGLEIGHQSTNGVIGLDNINLCQVKFKKTNGQWKYKCYE